MCMKKNNNRLLRGVAAVLCLALMFLTMSGMAMATDFYDLLKTSCVLRIIML
mgnify:CR=1 FL=1